MNNEEFVTVEKENETGPKSEIMHNEVHSGALSKIPSSPRETAQEEPVKTPRFLNCLPLGRLAKRRAPINLAKNRDVFMVTIDDLPPYYTTSIEKAKAVIKRYFSNLISYTGYEGFRTEDEPFREGYRMRLLRKSTVAIFSYESVESVATIQPLPLLM
jgi:hypothetical protein